jgi:hypothetical protein
MKMALPVMIKIYIWRFKIQNKISPRKGLSGVDRMALMAV